MKIGLPIYARKERLKREHPCYPLRPLQNKNYTLTMHNAYTNSFSFSTFSSLVGKCIKNHSFPGDDQIIFQKK